MKSYTSATEIDPAPKVAADAPVVAPYSETMDDLGIEPGDPYPTGTPVDPAVTFEQIHGYPPATLTAISPNTAVCGDATDITLSVTGTNFNAGSRIYFGNLVEPTVFVSETELTTIVKPSLFVRPDAVPVDVRNVRDGYGTDALDFTFTEPASGGTTKRSRAE